METILQSKMKYEYSNGKWLRQLKKNRNHNESTKLWERRAKFKVGTNSTLRNEIYSPSI